MGKNVVDRVYTHAMMNGQGYFVGKKLTVNFYDDHHRRGISQEFSFSLGRTLDSVAEKIDQ